jgi:acetyl-CoA carboxylase biotin carboxylase subunit
MRRCLRELRISGIKTTASFLDEVLSQPEFVEGSVDTKWVEREFLPRRS